MSDREGHGHKAVVYKSHFPPLRHFSCNRDTSRYLANQPRLTKDQALCSLCPHDRFFNRDNKRKCFHNEGNQSNDSVFTGTSSRCCHIATICFMFLIR